MSYCTTEDIIELFRPLTADELTKASVLIPVVEDRIEQEANRVGKSIEGLMDAGELKESVLKATIVDIVGRTLNQSNDSSSLSNTMVQGTQSALGYSVTGTFLNPGGGIYIKKSELRVLGIKRQRIGVIDLC